MGLQMTRTEFPLEYHCRTKRKPNTAASRSAYVTHLLQLRQGGPP
jgi:hypothetical protein